MLRTCTIASVLAVTIGSFLHAAPAKAESIWDCYGVNSTNIMLMPWCAFPSLGGGGGAKADLTAVRGPDKEVDCPDPEKPEYPTQSTIPRDPYACSTCYRATIVIHHPDGTVGTNVVRGKGLIVVRDYKGGGYESGQNRSFAKADSKGSGGASSGSGANSASK